MPAARPKLVVRFGVFEFDPASGDLWKGSRRIRLQNQPRQVLRILLSHPGELVTRDELRRELWPEDTFVDFDNGLNVAIRKIRDALGDTAPSPRFIETERAQGYRFIAPVTQSDHDRGTVSDRVVTVSAAEPNQTPAALAAAVVTLARDRYRRASVIAGLLALVVGVVALTSFRRELMSAGGTGAISYTQLTNFTDSAMAPAVSPDGRFVAFFRSNQWFLSPDQVWVKMLPNGEPVQLTKLGQAKYGIAFSPDGSRVSFTMSGAPGWRTLTVPTLGGEPTLFMQNAAGLSWIGPDRVLFSEIRTGLHMGIVTSRENRADRHEIYFPSHERAMAHYSWLSPDRGSVLIVEMDHTSAFQPCRVVPFDGSSPGWQVGPSGNCTAAAWSPDGKWMYFTVVVDGSSHLWRQRVPRGEPQQLTTGPNEESGIAMLPDGRSLVTSIGSSQTSLWMHDDRGDRQLTSEGYVEVGGPESPPQFSADGKYLYYLLRRDSPASNSALWRIEVASGKAEPLISGFSIREFDVSPDGEDVVFSTHPVESPSQMWIAPVDARTPPRLMGQPGDASPRFLRDGEIVFRMSVDAANYLAAMAPDGSHRRKVAPYPISNVYKTSPDRRWVVVLAPFSKVVGAIPSTIAIPVDGGMPREICPYLCPVLWTLDATTMLVRLTQPTIAGAGISAVIKLNPGQEIPNLPTGGLRADYTGGVPGLRIVKHTAWSIPGRDEATYAALRATTHRNLFQVTLP